MRQGNFIRALGLALVTLLAVAFATGSLTRAAPDLSEVTLDAYILSGGSALDLCRQKDGDHAHMSECSLCNLVSSCALPYARLSLTEVDGHFLTTIVMPQIRRAAAGLRDPAIPPRGPPRLI